MISPKEDFSILAELVEDSEPGGSRELDYRIAYTVGHPAGEPWDRMKFTMVGSKKDKEIPRYTSSLDAAAAIAPLRAVVEISWDNSMTAQSRAHCQGAHATGATPALALAAAALRARAVTADPGI